MADELSARVMNGLENCIKTIDGQMCPRDCQYFDACWGKYNEYIYAPLLKDAQALIQQQEQEIKRLRQDKEELLREVNRKVTISVGHGMRSAEYESRYKGLLGNEALTSIRKEALMKQLIEFCDGHGFIVYREDKTQLAEDVSKLTASMTVIMPQGSEKTLVDEMVKDFKEGYHGAGEAADLHTGNDGSAESAAGGQAGNAGGTHAGHCGGCEACQCDGEEKRVREADNES